MRPVAVYILFDSRNEKNLTMKTFSLCIFLIFTSTSLLFAQNLKNMTIRSEAGDVKEDFTVLKDNKDVRHGEYQMIFNSKIITAGHYENGARSGKWIYNDYNGIINFDGYFKNDSKDSIWTYYIGDTLQARMFYSHGVLDSSFSYYSNGNVLFEQRL